jgi:hypothetical protein
MAGVVLCCAEAESRAKSSRKAAGGGCEEREAVTIWWSPQEPTAEAPLRIMAVTEAGAEGELVVEGPGGARLPGKTIARGGPPWSFSVEVDKPASGSYEVSLRKGGKTLGCRRVRVLAKGGARPAAGKGGGGPVWQSRQAWNRSNENLFSAWVEQLFDAPPDQSVEFRPLHQALRDPTRNFLYNHLGLREDDPKNRAAVVAAPDCADLPYFLRGYFAWKVGLPFAFRDCDRGTDSRPPRCGAFTTNEKPAEGKDALSTIKKFFRLVMNNVQSGSARTALTDEQTDYYPLKLERSALRPGVVYADPFGHIMVIVKWVPQADKRGGLLLAVDGQPDASIGRKRFWEGTFLFTNETKSAGPGFKAFRPLVRSGAGPDALQPLPNKALAAAGAPGPYSAEQAQLSPDAFYARMGKLINPSGLEAVQAYGETLDALVEQMQVRIGSVDNGEKYMRENQNPVVPMPEGPKIFETVGPWEDYATPSRDMRLIIAMNVLTGLPDRIIRHPELYVLGGRKPEEVAAELRKVHQQRIGERSIEYKRSDGTPWKITVADLIARKSALEMAYNPNDCVEVRWGAAEGTPEHSTCKRKAPADQRARMTKYRAWFKEARRPPR